MKNICSVVLSYCDDDNCNPQINNAELLFKPVALWTYEAVKKLGIEDICISGVYENTKEFDENLTLFSVSEPVNASNAIKLADDFLKSNINKSVLIVASNVPYFSEESLKNAIASYNENGTALALRVYQEGENELGAVVGLIISVKDLLSKLESANSFLDVVKGASRVAVVCKRIRSAAGVKALSDILRDKILEKHIENGVYIPCTDGVVIGPDVSIEKETTILPGTIIKGKTTIGANCFIGPNSFISDSEFAKNVSFKASFAELSTVGEGTSIGPFCNLRPNSKIGKSVKIGDFVEVKNSNIGDKTSVAHLTYVGDSDVGSKVNFGCGTVTVNYDGKKKSRTVIGDNVFIGCNSNFIAPVKVENNCYIAAGSTITEDVPENALAIARSRQIIKLNWVTKRNDK